MPIHLRAEPGDYAEGCMLGYTGSFRGKRVSVQSSGMGCPSAGIVIEELTQLGVKKILRVGTCGGLQPDLRMGDLIAALSATPADTTPIHLVGGEPHAPTADWELVHAAVHHAKEQGRGVRVGGVVSSDLFYNPDAGQYQRWSDRGILAGDALFSERPEHLRDLARHAAEEGAELVVAGGGDGTVNEVASGIAGVGGVELAVIPRGTGVDFVRTYRIPTKLDGAVEVALGGATREIDGGRVGFRAWSGEAAEGWFFNAAGVGMSGAIARRTN